LPLTDTRIRAAKPARKPYKRTDSAGLCLEVRPSGSKLWRLRYRIAGRENMFALGEYVQAPAGESKKETEQRVQAGRLTLAEARQERDKARGLVKQGIHPAHNRQALRVAQIAEGGNTFETVAREWIEKNKARWTPYYLHQVERFLKADAFPYIGTLPVRSVTSAHLLEIVRRIEKRAPTVALLVRQWCGAVFRYAVATLRADGDPTVALKGAIHRPKVEHRKPLARSEIPNLVEKIEERGGNRTTKIAMRLLLLTWVRPVELRAADWKEFDLDRREWRIPAERMKMREAHVVPLSIQALELLHELKEITGGNGYLFRNNRRPKTFMTPTTLNRALERMGYGNKFSAHGFRATASTMLNEMGYSPDWIERQLAHKERNNTRAAYHQAQYLDERREMMQAWANTIDALARGDKVIPGKFGKTA
jgi:integrase